ncbi:hypothetical protein [uncultured Coprobacter sp.]|uniref:hypothetical protein n=1 Tax=uncultured Coprobacter sp. TaxID=1720550 RepID=UPI002604E171|nr:hypothetical protein [uncultured Coprobacter sp.]
MKQGESILKPKIGTTVYCIYANSISKYKVGYIGKEAFVIDELSEYMDFEAFLWWYEDFGKSWFKSLKEAKVRLLQMQSEYLPNQKVKIKKVNDDYWEVDYKN